MRGATRFLVGTLVGAAVGFALILIVSQRPQTRRTFAFVAPEAPETPPVPERELEEVAA
jgi:hypothetical protein